MEAALTRDAIQKMVNGEVTCEEDMSPVLQVTGLKHVLNDSPKRFLAELSDGEKSLAGMIRVTLNELIEAGSLRTGSYVQLTKFSVDVVHSRRIIFVADLKLQDGITGHVDGSLSPGEATNMELVMSSEPADSSFAPSNSGELVAQAPKQLVVTKLNEFRETLRKVEGFIRDTRTTKDQIRATIRCLNIMLVDFNTCWRNFESEVEELGGVVRPFSYASEKSTSDELRSDARILLKFLTKKTLKAFVIKFSARLDNTMKALKDMDNVLTSSMSLINQVMYEGFDCCKYEDEDEDEDADEF